MKCGTRFQSPLLGHLLYMFPKGAWEPGLLGEVVI